MQFKLIVLFSLIKLIENGKVVENGLELCNNSLICSMNDAGFSIMNKLEDSGNIFFSPFGLSMAFGMAYLGANGNTARQFETALNYEKYNVSSDQVHEQMRSLHENTTVGYIGSEYVIKVANALFYQNDSNINERYVEHVQHFYHGDTAPADFVSHSEESTQLINDWVKQETENKIDSLFSEPLSPETQVVLVDAIYFKGTWKIEFPRNRTFSGHFYKNDSEDGFVMVPMMSLADETFPYLKDEELGYKFLELPYKGEKFSMVFALPIKHDQKPDLDLTDLFCNIKERMVETELENILIPKFSFTYEKKMKETVKSLGLVDAFTPAADFSKISNGAGLYISDVIHKAVIEVNEQGSEAAAVSGIQIMPVSLREMKEFVANHPFLFFIVDNFSGAILFSGRLEDPTA